MKKWILVGLGAAAFLGVVAALLLTIGGVGSSKPKQPTAAQVAPVVKAYVAPKLSAGASVAAISCNNAKAGFTGPAADGSTKYYACIILLQSGSQTECTGATFTLLPKGEPKNFQIGQINKSYCGG